MKDTSGTELCPLDDIGAYVDGELSATAAEKLELHVDACEVCSRALLRQRQFLAALSASLDESNDIVLPKDFTKKIVSKAESSVSGVRRPYELFTAAFICSALFLFILFAFGGETAAAASALSSVGEKLLAVGGFLLTIVGNIAFASAVVARSLGAYSGISAVLLPVGLIVFGTFLYLSSRWVIRRRNAELMRG